MRINNFVDFPGKYESAKISTFEVFIKLSFLCLLRGLLTWGNNWFYHWQNRITIPCNKGWVVIELLTSIGLGLPRSISAVYTNQKSPVQYAHLVAAARKGPAIIDTRLTSSNSKYKNCEKKICHAYEQIFKIFFSKIFC